MTHNKIKNIIDDIENIINEYYEKQTLYCYSASKEDMTEDNMIEIGKYFVNKDFQCDLYSDNEYRLYISWRTRQNKEFSNIMNDIDDEEPILKSRATVKDLKEIANNIPDEYNNYKIKIYERNWEDNGRGYRSISEGSKFIDLCNIETVAVMDKNEIIFTNCGQRLKW